VNHGEGGRALLVIDVQNDFCPGGSLAVPGGGGVVPVINRLMPLFPVVVATQDWHPKGHVSFASSHPGAAPFSALELPGGSQTLWPDHCVPGTHGAELHAGLETLRLDLILRKGTRPELDSYSAFFENDRSTPTGLAGYLRERGVVEVFLSGLAADVCVYYSAMDAVRVGLAAAFVEDAARGIDAPPGSLSERLAEMRGAGVRMVRSDQLAREPSDSGGGRG
jgi:nicotinamidase/pyrazinamidase